MPHNSSCRAACSTRRTRSLGTGAGNQGGRSRTLLQQNLIVAGAMELVIALPVVFRIEHGIERCRAAETFFLRAAALLHAATRIRRRCEIADGDFRIWILVTDEERCFEGLVLAHKNLRLCVSMPQEIRRIIKRIARY